MYDVLTEAIKQFALLLMLNFICLAPRVVVIKAKYSVWALNFNIGLIERRFAIGRRKMANKLA